MAGDAFTILHDSSALVIRSKAAVQALINTCRYAGAPIEESVAEWSE
jgi:hypothetical protein